MARQTVTRLIDDLDGGRAHETVKFGLDGLSYEIDLSSRNASKLRKELAPFMDRGVRVSVRTAAARRRRGGTGGREENQAIRAWAERKGIEVASRGRIKQGVMDEYRRRAGR